MVVLRSCGALLLVCLFMAGADAGAIVAQPAVVNNQSSALLTCNYTGQGVVQKHFWTKNEKLIERSSEDSSDTRIEYKLEKIDTHDGGVYTCVFIVDGAEVKQNIEVKTLPHVFAPKRSEHGNEGDKGVLECVSHGYPLPLDWRWYKLADGKTETLLANGTGQYELMVTPNRTTLTIPELDIKKDPGDYVCRGVNEVGETSVQIHLRVRSRLAALWPFLGIVAEVAILITIIFIYEKRRKPDEITDDDDSGAAPLKNDSTNHKDKNVRQRNSN